MDTITDLGPTNSDLYATEDSWTCELEDGVSRQLGIYVEILDFRRATGEDRYATCPWMVQFEILPHEPSDKGTPFDEDTLEWINEAAGNDTEYRHALLREHLKSYGTGVPLTRQITTGVSTPGEEPPTPAGKVEGDDPMWPMFERYEDAKAYAEALLEQRAGALMGLVGFILDQPFNGRGDNGWSLLRVGLTEEAA